MGFLALEMTFLMVEVQVLELVWERVLV